VVFKIKPLKIPCLLSGLGFMKVKYLRCMGNMIEIVIMSGGHHGSIVDAFSASHMAERTQRALDESLMSAGKEAVKWLQKNRQALRSGTRGKKGHATRNRQKIKEAEKVWGRWKKAKNDKWVVENISVGGVSIPADLLRHWGLWPAESQESESQEGDSQEGESQEGDSQEGDSQEGDSQEGDSQEDKSQEGDSQEGDSKEGDSQEGDSQEDKSQEAESQEAKRPRATSFDDAPSSSSMKIPKRSLSMKERKKELRDKWNPSPPAPPIEEKNKELEERCDPSPPASPILIRGYNNSGVLQKPPNLGVVATNCQTNVGVAASGSNIQPNLEDGKQEDLCSTCDEQDIQMEEEEEEEEQVQAQAGGQYLSEQPLTQNLDDGSDNAGDVPAAGQNLSEQHFTQDFNSYTSDDDISPQ